MHIGIKLPSWGPLASSDSLTATATIADRRGYDSVWVSDHVVTPLEPASRYPFSVDGRPPFDPRTPFQDPLVALAFVAAVTERVQLATGVLVLALRHPVLVAKQAATLDALSGGRLVLGIGVGWMREEFELVGQDFEGRGAATEAAVATLRACWSDDPVDLGDGTPRLRPFAMSPKPAQGAGVPVVMGGHSAAARRRAARIGDGWYGSNIDPLAFEALANDARQLVASERPGTTFRVGVKAPVTGPGDAARLVKEYAAAGADFLVFDMDFTALSTSDACRTLERIADELALDDRRSIDGRI